MLEYGRKTDAGEEDTVNRRPIVYFAIRCPCAWSQYAVQYAVRGIAKCGSHPKRNSPIANNTPSVIIGGNLVSGTARSPFALKSLKYCLLL